MVEKKSIAIQGVIDPLIFSPWNNYGSAAKNNTIVESANPYLDSEIEWQKSVYEFANEIAESEIPRRVVDLGCGSGKKIQKFKNKLYELIQVDFADLREYKQPGVAFIECNFTSTNDVSYLESKLSSKEHTLFILSDVIEHLEDPRIILKMLRRLLRNHPKNLLVISTPDRDRIDGFGSLNAPNNKRHYRQWNYDEFASSLMSSGFEIEEFFHAKQNDHDDYFRTMVAKLKCSELSYKKFLKSVNISNEFEHLILTSEHSKISGSGGIGSYIEEIEKVFQENNSVKILMTGTNYLVENAGDRSLSENLLDADYWAGNEFKEVMGINFPELPEKMLDAVLQILFIVDTVRLIEYQDYLGIGFRVAQAKKAGLISPGIKLLCYCHGNTFYLDNAASELSRTRELHIDVMERISIELADKVFFPSDFLKDLYLNQQKLKITNYQIQRYPISKETLKLQSQDFKNCSILIFFGRDTKQKGFFDFYEAIKSLGESEELSNLGISKVIFMGVDEKSEYLLEFNQVSVEFFKGTRQEAISFLKTIADKSAVFLPYKGDNQPISFFDIIPTGARPVLANAGGIPEIIPDPLKKKLLAQPSVDGIKKVIKIVASESNWERFEISKELNFLVESELIAARAKYLKSINDIKKEVNVTKSKKVKKLLTVVLVNFNGDISILSDAIFGINNSFYKPSELIVVDDSSSDENYGVLVQSLSSIDKSIKITVIRNEHNIGLPASRNVALKHVETEFVCFHDNDNVVLSDFFDLSIEALLDNENVSAVTSFNSYFIDGMNWRVNSSKSFHEGYRPIGPDLGLGFRSNVFGDALSVYRTSSLRKVNGWNASTRAKWEDWELFITLIQSGYDIVLIPKPMFLYRIREGSMSRTYNDFHGFQRIYNQLPVPNNMRYSLYRSLVYQMQSDLHPTSNIGACSNSEDHEKLNLILASRSWRLTKYLRILNSFAKKRKIIQLINFRN